MQEQWKDIGSYEGLYRVSNLGKVFSVRTNKLLSLWKDKDGYLRCNLKKHSVVRQASVHRLVAEAFVPNPENKPQVNHKNGIRHDNSVHNLDWCTCLENQQHKYKVLGYKPSREQIEKLIKGAKRYANLPEVKQQRAQKMRRTFSKKIVDITTGIVYNSQHEASVKTGCSQGLISSVCIGNIRHTKGHIFRFC